MVRPQSHPRGQVAALRYTPHGLRRGLVPVSSPLAACVRAGGLRFPAEAARKANLIMINPPLRFPRSRLAYRVYLSSPKRFRAVPHVLYGSIFFGMVFAHDEI